MLVLGQTEIFPGMMKAAFDTSRTAFEIAIGLAGAMTLWLGVMRIGEQGGLLRLLTRLMTPMASRRCARCRSGARAMMVETMQTHGADSFAGRLASVIQGSTETTFYVLAVYFGSVGIRYTRHAVSCALLADLAGITTAILVAYLFFG